MGTNIMNSVTHKIRLITSNNFLTILIIIQNKILKPIYIASKMLQGTYLYFIQKTVKTIIAPLSQHQDLKNH